MKILVTGSSGLIGSMIVSFFKANHHQVLKLVRKKQNLAPDEISWDPDHGVISPFDLEGLDVVIHLAGENLIGRWTVAKKEKIRASRINGTALLAQVFRQLANPPGLFICASAIGYYGNRGDEVLTESSAKGAGFLADVCQEWEEATQAAKNRGIQTVNLRFGMVLSVKGGALKKMLFPFKWGLGGKIGSGDQYMSWITLEDLIRVIVFTIETKSLIGPVNTVSPYPVRNSEFTKILGEALNRPTFFSLPKKAVELMFGEMGKETILVSQQVQPQELEEKGFQFNHPHLKEALIDLLTHQK